MSKTIDRISSEKKRLKNLNADVIEALKKYSGLSVIYEDEVPVSINGSFILSDNSTTEQGRWEIRILIPKNYPHGFPLLFETSNYIIPSEDTHKHDDGSICVELDIICLYIARKGISICDFINLYVLKYFSWILLYQNGLADNLKFWNHKDDGYKQFFNEVLNSNNDLIIRKILLHFLNNSLPGRNDSCLCESDRKYKNCQWKCLEELKKNNINDLRIFIKKLYPDLFPSN
jgi:hypothetical protein